MTVEELDELIDEAVQARKTLDVAIQRMAPDDTIWIEQIVREGEFVRVLAADGRTMKFEASLVTGKITRRRPIREPIYNISAWG